MPCILVIARADMANGVEAGDVVSVLPEDRRPGTEERTIAAFAFVHCDEAADHPDVLALLEPKLEPGAALLDPDHIQTVRHRARQIDVALLLADTAYRSPADPLRARMTRAQLRAATRPHADRIPAIRRDSRA